MIQLLDVNPVSKGVATIFADTKTEVPGTAAALYAALEPNEWTKKLNPGLAAGTIIITSTFDVAFVRSDGLIQWKGEEPPTPPAEPVTVTITMQSGQKCRFAYIDAEDDNTLKAVTYTESGDYELVVPQYSTMYVVPGDGAISGGSVITTADYKVVYSNGDNGSPYTIVYIEEDTAITIGY